MQRKDLYQNGLKAYLNAIEVLFPSITEDKLKHLFQTVLDCTQKKIQSKSNPILLCLVITSLSK